MHSLSQETQNYFSEKKNKIFQGYKTLICEYAEESKRKPTYNILYKTFINIPKFEKKQDERLCVESLLYHIIDTIHIDLLTSCAI